LETDFAADHIIDYKCNICGHKNKLAAGDFHREAAICGGCGSNARFRGIIHGLSMALMKTSVPLPKFTKDRYVKGIGMSEWDGYAKVLKKKYDFTNTYFHQEPLLDITSDDWQKFTDLDFVICTEVFEHVLQPLQVGFENMRKMLKKGGHLVFSTPFNGSPETVEHFPGMVDFATCQIGEDWLVVSRKADGSYEIYDQNIIFHGGPGTVLEMRMFGRESLLAQLRAAGFAPTVFSQAIPEIGYYWPKVMDRPELGYPGEHYVILCEAI